MKLLVAYLAAALALFSSIPVSAASTAPSTQQPAATSAAVPFDPPLDAPVRYRWEKTVQKDGRSDMSWSVSEYRFKQVGEGYQLTVTPIDRGSNETDPTKLAMLKRLEELISRPYVLKLDADGVIQELVDADSYWSAIIIVLKEALAKESTKSKDSAGLQPMIQSVVGMFEKMPPDARLALLTEEVQPVIEFANTETEMEKPITATVETESPFGGVLNRDVVIELRGVSENTARLSIRSSIPRAELDKLVQSVFAQFASLPAEKRAETQAGIAALDGFQHETISEYEVSLDDGLVARFHSIETVDVRDKTKSRRKITTRKMERLLER